ncbi:FAD-dependent oxidoreductase [Gordonia sp. VNK1]|uniref:FAD-dependent oxidoreductase n=1 Tax=Gordonia oleivorans TaxID=3156618 RepID=UPI0032B4EC46
MTRPRVIIAGMGDTGMLTAIALSRHVDVVGISLTDALVSGQELGLRLARPDVWAGEYALPYRNYRKLDEVRIIQGRILGADLDRRTVTVDTVTGGTLTEPFDALVIATGVRNGFWRTTDLRSTAAVRDDLAAHHHRIAQASSVIVVGGGASAVSAAINIATRFPTIRVDLYFPAETPLRQHHRRVWTTLRRRLEAAGVGLHPGHRAELTGVDTDDIGSGPVRWSTGQPDAVADAVIWAVGASTPNTGWVPAEILDDRGFVTVTPRLQIPDHPEVFAVGDVAATDPLRSSARNRADRLVAHNVRAHLAGRRLRAYRPPRRRWGSVIGPQADGLQVFAPNGRVFRFPAWSVRTVLWPVIVRRGIYRGVRDRPSVWAKSPPDED